MSNSKPSLVITGYIENEKTMTNYTKIVTAAGENLLVESKGITKSFPIEAGGVAGLTRIFIDQDSSIWLGVSAESILTLSKGTSSEIGRGTILKWLDDGGTISKSRDDSFSAEVLP